MPGTYQQLLDATIQHLKQLQEDGEKYLKISPETWQLLHQRPRATGATPPGTSTTVQPMVATKTVPQVGPAPVIIPAKAGAAPASSNSTVSAERTAAMAALRERALACVKCPHLAASRRNVVFGVGDIFSPLMFIGEAPGMDEDEQAEPFVGKAGQLLTRIISTMGFTRDTVYIANVLKCRPDTPGQASGNRKPTLEEMKTCLPYLLAQVDLIQPKVIVTLGATAMEGLFGQTVYITKIRGQWQEFRGIPVMPTYHPSYLLRNQAPAVKRQVWEDMLQVLEKLDQPISDKQRNYFLKGQ